MSIQASLAIKPKPRNRIRMRKYSVSDGLFGPSPNPLHGPACGSGRRSSLWLTRARYKSIGDDVHRVLTCPALSRRFCQLIMSLLELNQPIALRPDHIAACTTTLFVTQHQGAKLHSEGEEITVKRQPYLQEKSENRDQGEKLFSIDSEVVPLSQRRFFRDASGLPLFELVQKKAGVTWFVYLPGQKEKGNEGEAIAAIAPRWNPLKNKLDVYVRNAGDGKEKKLKVRGLDMAKSRTHVYYLDQLAMDATRVDAHKSVTRLEWRVEVAKGLDVSLVCVSAGGLVDANGRLR